MPSEMNQVTAILDENGLESLEAVNEFVHKRPYRDIVSLRSGIDEAVRIGSKPLRNHEKPTLDQANFLASSSLRGHRSCENWLCRGPRVELLARYVALYCDKAIVPVNFEITDIANDERRQALQRHALATALSELVTLRPLIEAELIVLVQEELHFCKEHWQEAVPGHMDVLRAAQDLARHRSPEFEVTYEPHNIDGRTFSMITINGPVDYIEHGTISTIFSETPPWALELEKQGSVTLSKDFVEKHGLLARVFSSLANDAFLQTCFGMAFNARYVTDLPGEAEFFKALGAQDELSIQTSTLCTQLTHEIPTLRDVPLEVVLKVRQDEPEAFQSYRSTLTSIVRDYVRKDAAVGEQAAKDIYLDILKPRLDALELQAANIRRMQAKRGVVKTVASSALLGMGVLGGLLPSTLSGLVKTIGGFNVAENLAETFAAIERNPTEVRNHNLYFLLRLKQKAT